jgi:hypothetical protein
LPEESEFSFFSFDELFLLEQSLRATLLKLYVCHGLLSPLPTGNISKRCDFVMKTLAIVSRLKMSAAAMKGN